MQRLFLEAVPFRIERGHELLEPFLAKGLDGGGRSRRDARRDDRGAPRSSRSGRGIRSPARRSTPRSRSPARPRSRSTTRACTNSRRSSPTRCSARCFRARQPNVPGLEVGEVYESSARVDVGGDIYDFLELGDGRLAVVLGDVTGHGVEATADMAMAKFVFRSLAREHPEPGDFLAFANDVVVDEIAPGKFITMTYLAVDPGRGEVACANAGHPPPRLVLPDGSVRGLESRRDRARHRLRAGRTRRCARSCRSARRSFSTPTASSRRGAGATSTAPNGSTRLLSRQRELPAAELARARDRGRAKLRRRRALGRPRRRRHPSPR